MPSREVIDNAKALVGSSVRGKWRLDALLGVGGSAAVFAATHRNGKRGALKILRREFAQDRETRDRFLREGYVANLVGHRGTVAMLDDDLDAEGTPFLVMELLEGSTLERVIRKNKSLPLREVLRIAESVLDVLEAAHAQGVVHGDIKPANIFITNAGDVKLLDFGIASVDTGAPRSERMGGVLDALGTPSYMSPEQARGERVDGRADVWAVGAVMFALVTGKRPRQGASAAEELVMAASTPMLTCKDVAPYLSSELSEVIDRALAFDTSLRWPDATTMQQALRLALLLEQASRPVDEDLLVPPPVDAGPHLPHALRLLKQSESSMPTRRLPAMFGLGRPQTPSKSTSPPGPSTTRAFAVARSTRPPEHEPRDGSKPNRARLAFGLGALLTLGVGVGLAFFEPLLGFGEALAGAGDSDDSAADAGARDASFSDSSR